MKKVNSSGVELLSNLGRKGKSHSIYLCKCPICGNNFEMYSTHYYRGSNSCKCRYIGVRNKRLYSIWINMKTRCYNSKATGFQNYGGRGIRVCDEWRNSFKAFYEWSIANGYRDNLTIERISVNGNYEPNNCKWADVYEQASNKRNNVLVSGMSLRSFCNKNGLNYKSVHTMKSRHPELAVDEIVSWYLERLKKEVQDNAGTDD